LLLAERGLVRPLNSRDRKTLVAENREAACMHCGAAIAARTGAGAGAAESCSHCASPLIVLDLQRLMASVMVRHALPLPADDGQLASWSCRACGDSVDPTRMTRCERCAHEVVAPSLADALPLLLALEPLLQGMRAPGAQPLGERLRRQRGYASTAFFRHLVRPFTAGVQQQFEHLEWYSWRTGSTLLIALWLAWLWWR
jgi:hypothetical protein